MSDEEVCGLPVTDFVCGITHAAYYAFNVENQHFCFVVVEYSRCWYFSRGFSLSLLPSQENKKEWEIIT
jgi:hypothetical protein